MLAMQSAGTAAKVQRSHVGITALPEHLVASVEIAKSLMKIGIVGICLDNNLKRLYGGVHISLILDNRRFQKPGKLTIDSGWRNISQFGDRGVILAQIRHLLRQQKAREFIVWINEDAEAEPRRNRSSGVVLPVMQRHRDHRVGDDAPQVGNRMGLAVECGAHMRGVELAGQPVAYDPLDSVAVSHAGMEGGKLQHEMRRCQPVLQTADTLHRFICKAEPFRHQGGVQPEIGGHATIRRNGEATRLEKRRDAGIAAAVGDKRPAPDQPGHHLRCAILGNPVGKNSRGRPVAVPDGQRRPGFAAKRYHHIEAFKLPAKRGSAFDVTIIILSEKGLTKYRHAVGIGFQRVEEKVRRLHHVVEIERLPCRQIMPGGGRGFMHRWCFSGRRRAGRRAPVSAFVSPLVHRREMVMAVRVPAVGPPLPPQPARSDMTSAAAAARPAHLIIIAVCRGSGMTPLLPTYSDSSGRRHLPASPI